MRRTTSSAVHVGRPMIVGADSSIMKNYTGRLWPECSIVSSATLSGCSLLLPYALRMTEEQRITALAGKVSKTCLGMTLVSAPVSSLQHTVVPLMLKFFHQHFATDCSHESICKCPTNSESKPS